MAHSTEQRTCGNCGEAVQPSALTCPSCDALLAAYETPAGSAVASDLASRAISEPVTIVEQAAPLPSLDTPAETATSTQSRPASPERAPFNADAALEEARRTLGMPSSTELSSAPERFEGIRQEPVPTPAPAQSATLQTTPRPSRTPEPEPHPGALSVTRTSVVSATQPNLTTTPPDTGRKRASLAQRQATTETRRRAAETAASHPEPPQPAWSSPHEVGTSTPISTAQMAKYAFLLIMFLLIMSRTQFGFSPFFVLLFAFGILASVMQKSAKAGGRKTTWMQRLNDHDPWNTPRS